VYSYSVQLRKSDNFFQRLTISYLLPLHPLIWPQTTNSMELSSS
jgi:hypothetical protein